MFTRSNEAWKTPEDPAGNSFYTIDNWWVMEINTWASVYNSGHFSSMLHNWYRNWADKGNNMNPKLVINWWIFDWWIKTVKNDDYGILTINWWTYKNNTQWCILNRNIATINWWTFSPDSTHAIELGYKSTNNDYDKAELTINWWMFEWGFGYNDSNNTGHTVELNWWVFSVDPSAYVAENHFVKADEDKFVVVSSMPEATALDWNYAADPSTAVSWNDIGNETKLKDLVVEIEENQWQDISIPENIPARSGNPNVKSLGQVILTYKKDETQIINVKFFLLTINREMNNQF